MECKVPAKFKLGNLKASPDATYLIGLSNESTQSIYLLNLKSNKPQELCFKKPILDALIYDSGDLLYTHGDRVRLMPRLQHIHSRFFSINVSLFKKHGNEEKLSKIHIGKKHKF